MTTPGAYAVLRFMSENQIPLTRENFVNANWGGNPPRPWDYEAEEEIPLELQDYPQAEDAYNPNEPRDERGRWTAGGAAHKALAGAFGKKVSISPAGRPSAGVAPRSAEGRGGLLSPAAARHAGLEAPVVDWAKRQIAKHSAAAAERARRAEWMSHHIQDVHAFFDDKRGSAALLQIAESAAHAATGAAFHQTANAIADALKDALIAAAIGAGVAAFGFGAPQVILSAVAGYVVEQTAEFLGITPKNAITLLETGASAVINTVRGDFNSVTRALNSVPFKDAEGEQFVSSNIKSGKDVSAALQQIKGKRHKALLKATRQINSGLGIPMSEPQSAVGAWIDGAEDTVMTTTHGASMNQLKVAAAMEGALANQRSVLVVNENVSGKGILYHFDVKGDLNSIHEGLLNAGVEFHTIVPNKDGGSTVYVASPDASNATFRAVEKAAGRFNAQVQFHRVDAALVGSDKEDGTDEEQRADAQQRYARTIAGSGLPAAAVLWARVHSRFRSAFEEPRRAPAAAGVGAHATA